tara:strand:+ start:324 stop:569 length:246 start_codon:yes stop_codon:yes gene_type:complete
MKEDKYIHPVNLEIPMDFWYAVEKQIVDRKIKEAKKITKKDHIQELLELGYAEKEKQLNKGNSEPKKPISENSDGWQTDAR